MEPFDYFLDPKHPLSHWSDDSGRCYFCGFEGPGFDGPYYGLVDDLERVCERCLRDGKLVAVNMRTCEGDLRSLRKQLEVNGELTENDREKLASARTQALEHHTPGIHTWQDFSWPAHCGDFCQFVEELGKPEIAKLAGEGDPAEWFLARADGASEGVWQGVRESSARKHPQDSYDLTVYAFRCRVCSDTIIHWDCS